MLIVKLGSRQSYVAPYGDIGALPFLSKETNTQTLKYTNTQVHKYTSTQVEKYITEKDKGWFLYDKN